MKNNQFQGEHPISISPELEQQFTQFCNGDLTPSQAQAIAFAIAQSIECIDFLTLSDDSWMVRS